MRKRKKIVASFMALMMAITIQSPTWLVHAEDLTEDTTEVVTEEQITEEATEEITEDLVVVDEEIEAQQAAGTIGCWMQYDDHEGRAEAVLMNSDGTVPVEPEYVPGSELKLVLNAPEECDINNAIVEIETLFPDEVADAHEAEIFREIFIGDNSDVEIGTENNATYSFTLSSAANFFMIRVYWSEEERVPFGGVEQKSREYIYAYSYVGFDEDEDGVPEYIDYDGDGNVGAAISDSDSETKEDIRWALASELYSKFIQYNNYGLEDDSFISQDPNFNPVSEMYNRIDLADFGKTIEAEKANGTKITIPVWEATVNWTQTGVDEYDDPIFLTTTIPVYILPQVHNVLICEGYDYEVDYDNGENYYCNGEKYHIRHVFDDRVKFTNSGSDEFAEDGDQGIVIIGSGEGAIIGGHATDTYTLNETEKYRVVEQFTTPENLVIGNDDPYGYNVRIRFMLPDASYISVKSEGETKKYDGLQFNGYSTDTVYEIGEEVNASIFIGDNTFYVSPVTVAGIEESSIVNVEIADSSMAAGVKIDKSDLDNVKVEFLSNFYDYVPLKITYDNGTVNYINIQRNGLVIRDQILNSSKSQGNVSFDCWGEENFDKGPSFTYNFAAGERRMIFATYYHPSNYRTLSGDDDLKLVITFEDGTTRVISQVDEAHNYNGFASGAAYGAVDTTTFIIDFVGDDVENYKGGFNAIVVNGGYDDPTTFGGAQVGRGTGVAWDGELSDIGY